MVFIIKLYFDELMIVTTSRFLNSKNLLWERTNPSLAWLMPQQGFWPDDEVTLGIHTTLRHPEHA